MGDDLRVRLSELSGLNAHGLSLWAGHDPDPASWIRRRQADTLGATPEAPAQVALDLSEEDAVDRVLRWMGRRLGFRAQLSAPRWYRYGQTLWRIVESSRWLDPAERNVVFRPDDPRRPVTQFYAELRVRGLGDLVKAECHDFDHLDRRALKLTTVAVGQLAQPLF